MSDLSLNETVLDVLDRNRVAVFVVAYNAEKHIENVINRIPNWITPLLSEIYVIDDSSSDQTFKVANDIKITKETPLNIYRTPDNQGYGGNQILGYQHAIEKEHDIVVLLHGDGQYAPEELPQILAPYHDSKVSAVFGSRFMDKGKALQGGMPKYKFLGNRILTFTQNKLLGANLSEMHSGYRSYRMSKMKNLPFKFNSKNFDFDADIIIQFIEAGYEIVEVPIPTYYGDEICHVNGMQYAWRCIRACVINLLMKIELFYDPKFDLSSLNNKKNYIKKESKRSIHSFVRNFNFGTDTNILDLGGGDGESVSQDLARLKNKVTCIDQCEADSNTEEYFTHIKSDLDTQWSLDLKNEKFSHCLALDVIEHLKCPENGLEQLFNVTKKHGQLILSTGNIAFLPIRLMLLLGAFNYGRKGILDLTHKRLFTLKSFRRIVTYQGFSVKEIKGFGIPITDLAPNLPFSNLLETLSHYMATIFPSLFAYQLLIICQRPLCHSELMKQTFNEEDSL